MSIDNMESLPNEQNKLDMGGKTKGRRARRRSTKKRRNK